MIRILHKLHTPNKLKKQRLTKYATLLIVLGSLLFTTQQTANAQDACKDYLRQHISVNGQDNTKSQNQQAPVPPPSQPGAVKTVDINDQLGKPVNIHFFTSQNCKVCPEMRDNLYEFDAMNQKVTLKEYELTQIDATYLLKNAEKVLDIDLKSAPIIFVGTYPVVGACNIYNEVPYLLQSLINVSNGNSKSLIDDLISLGGNQKILTDKEIDTLKEDYNIVEKTSDQDDNAKSQDKEVTPTPQQNNQQTQRAQVSFFERLILLIKHLLGIQ